jgi:hypothetical protein
LTLKKSDVMPYDGLISLQFQPQLHPSFSADSVRGYETGGLTRSLAAPVTTLLCLANQNQKSTTTR